VGHVLQLAVEIKDVALIAATCDVCSIATLLNTGGGDAPEFFIRGIDSIAGSPHLYLGEYR
jgi:hypothetical protein